MNMKKAVLLLIIIAFLFGLASGNGKQKMVVFSYHKPYEYELIDGKYRVQAIIDRENWTEGMKVSFDGEVLPAKKLDNGNVRISLPLVGNPGFLEITKKDGLSKQHFEPLIPADWDYFGRGKVHVIVSSHQDIGWMNTPDSCRHERVHDIVLPALDLMEKEPGFKFEMEQSLNLMEVLEDSPENKQRLIDTYKSGNFEWGATFTQPYEGLESGEQLVRQSYLGRRWIKKNTTGNECTCCLQY